MRTSFAMTRGPGAAERSSHPPRHSPYLSDGRSS
jgi:hypothetical protein